MGDVDPELLKTAERVILDGVACYLVSYSETGSTVQVWVHGEYGVPVKVQIDEAGVMTTMEYKNMRVGEIPDETFTLPEDVQVIEY